jgi:hypothetical protein
MPPDPALRARLQRLGLRPLKEASPPIVSSPAPPPSPATLYDTLPGREVVTALGAFQLIEIRHAAEAAHGTVSLSAYLNQSPAIAAQIARDDALAAVALRDLAFLDTETTGLAGGAGTLAFMVGVGVWEGNAFVVRQYFLRHPGEEEAMLHALADLVAPRAGWVTFNGKAFDVPLLQGRLILNHLRGAFGAKPHLDLLTPARRLYQHRLPSCRLGELERALLGLTRDQADVPGEMIPALYQNYLRTGDPGDMHRIFYHNALDVLAMVALGAHLLDVFGTPLSSSMSEAQRPKSGESQSRITNSQAGPTVHSPQSDKPRSPIPNPQSPATLLRLALWHDDNDRLTEAETAYRMVLHGPLDLEDRRVALMRYAALLKRLDRRAEAAPLWEQWAAFTLDETEPLIELAKYHEWHTRDVPLARRWAERALAIAEGQPPGWRRDAALDALRHRAARLVEKLEVKD